MPIRDGVVTVGFTYEALDGLVGDRGTPYIHEIALPCPCMQIDPKGGMAGHPDPNCRQCVGKGYLYEEARKSIGLVSGLSNNKFWAQVSWISPGDLSLSPLIQARRVTDFDRITLAVPVPFEGMIIVRGTDSPFSPRVPELAENEDLLYFEAGREQATIILDEDGKRYFPGNYWLDGRTIKWAGGPAVGKKYSIKYEAFPEFIAWTTPVDRWDLKQELGQRVLLRRVTMEANPKNRVIRPPWKELMENGPKFTDKPYSQYGKSAKV